MWLDPEASGLISGDAILISIRIKPTESARFGPIAQLWLERTPDKREVTGSIPVRPTNRVTVEWILVTSFSSLERMGN